MHGTPHIVSDVMTHTVAAFGREARFKEIVRTMQEWKVSALPVLEGEGHRRRRRLRGRLTPKLLSQHRPSHLLPSWPRREPSPARR